MKGILKCFWKELSCVTVMSLMWLLPVSCSHKKDSHEVNDTFIKEQVRDGVGDAQGQSEPQETDVWIEEPDSVSGVVNAVLHRFITREDDGFYKAYSSIGSRNFYYNNRHGYFVGLPADMGENQRGENWMGAHGNEFYNQDTTLVVSCEAMFYDVVLPDSPHYEDTLRNNHLKQLEAKGRVKFLSRNPNEIVAKVFIDRTNRENPPSDYLLSKWVLKKDIDNRECDMSLNIWYNDSLKHREPELLNIINKFPNNPFNN